MSKPISFSVCAALAGMSFAGVYEGYEDWQWRPVHVADSNAAGKVNDLVLTTVYPLNP